MPTTMAARRIEGVEAARLTAITEAMAEPIERLLDLAFGYDRHQRTAYRLRARVAAEPAASCAAIDPCGVLVGSLQSWPLALVEDDGAATPLWLVGPVAVLPERRNLGIARAMIAHALAEIDRTGLSAVLIGDLDYYGPFGFSSVATGGWAVPGPVERNRLLCRPAPYQPLPATGTLRAREAAPR